MLEKYLGIPCTLVRDTNKAVLIRAEIEGVQHDGLWIPKSVLHEDSQDEVAVGAHGDETELYIAAWWMEENL